jgi:hypothetical protein
MVQLGKEANPVEFYTFFKERDRFLKATLEQLFDQNSNIFKAYGLPESFEHLLKHLFESQRSDKTSLIKFFT